MTPTTFQSASTLASSIALQEQSLLNLTTLDCAFIVFRDVLGKNTVVTSDPDEILAIRNLLIANRQATIATLEAEFAAL